jgi:hypothetical protein
VRSCVESLAYGSEVEAQGQACWFDRDRVRRLWWCSYRSCEVLCMFREMAAGMRVIIAPYGYILSYSCRDGAVDISKVELFVGDC